VGSQLFAILLQGTDRMIIKRKNMVWVGLGCLVVLGACIYIKGSMEKGKGPSAKA